MVTADEIRAVQVFECLDETACERLARVAADINLVPGEFAAEEGAERALFAVLAGRIEATRNVDGIDRVLGERLPGDVFGEVPITLGTFFPVGFRAAEPTRVMRIEPHDYHAVAAVAPEVAEEIGKLASHRMSGSRGLQGLAAAPPPPRATVLGERWDAQCSRAPPVPRPQPDLVQMGHARRRRRGRAVGRPLPPGGDLPVIRLADGKTVVRPQLRRVAELLGLGTEPAAAEYDTVIVGAGPGGPRRRGLRRLRGTAHDRRRARGPGRPGRDVVAHRELPRLPRRACRGTSSRAARCRRRGGSAPRSSSRARSRASTRHSRQVHLDGGDVLRGKTIILACGVSWRQLAIEGFDRLVGKGISYGAARSEAPNVHGLDVHIVGAGNSAGQAAMFFSTHANTVTILCRGDGAREEHVALPHRPARDAAEHRRR